MALFAALSYAVTQSSRGGGTGIDAERATLNAASVLDYKTLVNTTILRMTIRGTEVLNFQFYGGALNPCTSGTDCVFAPDGGGLTYVNSVAGGSINYGNAVNPATDHRAVSGGVASLHQFHVHGLSLETCEEINDALGLANPPAQTGNALQFTAYPGEREACLLEWDGSEYIFYAVLVPTQ